MIVAEILRCPWVRILLRENSLLNYNCVCFLMDLVIKIDQTIWVYISVEELCPNLVKQISICYG